MSTPAEVLSLEDLSTTLVPEAGEPPVVDAERRERARAAREQRNRQRELVASMSKRAALYRRWHLEAARERGSEALRAEESLIIRTPVPPVMQSNAYGELVLVQYARGRDFVICACCNEPCPKDGKKSLVVLSPWGLWCPSCALKAPSLIGDRGKHQYMAERRRSRARLTTSLKKAVTTAR